MNKDKLLTTVSLTKEKVNALSIKDKLLEKIDKFATENSILRLYLAEIAVGVDKDGLEYTREGMMEMAKEALKGKEE